MPLLWRGDVHEDAGPELGTSRKLAFTEKCPGTLATLALLCEAVGYFNAGTIKIFGQSSGTQKHLFRRRGGGALRESPVWLRLRLPLVALVSTYLLSRHYSREQWQESSELRLRFETWSQEGSLPRAIQH